MNSIQLHPLSGLDLKKELCPCRVCRSDMAYVAPCEYRDSIEFTLIDPTKGLNNDQSEPTNPAEAAS